MGSFLIEDNSRIDVLHLPYLSIFKSDQDLWLARAHRDRVEKY